MVESPALANQVQPAQYHSVNGSTGLRYDAPYTVDHKIFDGYTYYGSYILNDGSLTEGDSATVSADGRELQPGPSGSPMGVISRSRMCRTASSFRPTPTP